MKVHSSDIMRDSQKAEIPKVSIHRGMDKDDEGYPFNGVSSGHKEAWNPDTHYDGDESQKHDSKWKKPHVKDHI